MQEVQQLLRFVFQTENELTVPVSGTGSAGMEAALCNFIEPGDSVLVAVLGYFGERMVEMAGRYRSSGRSHRSPLGRGHLTQTRLRLLSARKNISCWHWYTQRPPPESCSTGIAEIASCGSR